MQHRSSYTPPPMRMNRIAKVGGRFIAYVQAERGQLKYLVPGISVYSRIQEDLTFYSQRAADAGCRCRIKLYELKIRKNIVMPVSVPISEVAFVFILRGNLRARID
ncbi:MAG TPA: hypothetical protein VFS31_10800, partial [Chitinophagaceae bacterium]|nr:hypothetical protein [Chitinophagaceae bacterium]